MMAYSHSCIDDSFDTSSIDEGHLGREDDADLLNGIEVLGTFHQAVTKPPNNRHAAPLRLAIVSNFNRVVENIAALLGLSCKCVDASGNHCISTALLSICNLNLIALFQRSDLSSSVSQDALEAIFRAFATALLDSQASDSNQRHESTPSIRVSASIVSTCAARHKALQAFMTAQLSLALEMSIMSDTATDNKEFNRCLAQIVIIMFSEVILVEEHTACPFSAEHVDLVALVFSMQRILSQLESAGGLSLVDPGNTCIDMMRSLILSVIKSGEGTLLSAAIGNLPKSTALGKLVSSCADEHPELWHNNIPPTGNLLDDMNNVKQWILDIKTDSKEFAKHFPHMTQDLKDGKISPDAVAIGLLERAEIPLIEDKQDRWKDMCSRRLTLLVVPPQSMKSNRNSAAKFSMDLFSEICQRETGKADYEWNEPFEVKQALNCVCEQWASTFDSVMYVQPGTFLENCIVYQMMQEEFIKDTFPQVVSRGKSIKNELRSAACGIVDGILEVEHTCWECSTKMPKIAPTCSSCLAALYCFRECQRTAWNDGHKQMCKILCSKNEMIHQSFEAINNANKENDGSWTSNVPRCTNHDTVVAHILLFQPCPFPDVIWNGDMQRPSMKMFYENLARVHRREWWFYPLDDELTMEEYLQRRVQLPHPNVDEQEWELFQSLVYCLGFDSIHHLDSFANDRKEEFGLAMPAERFLSLYRVGVDGICTRGNESSIRQWKKVSKLKLRESFHKYGQKKTLTFQRHFADRRHSNRLSRTNSNDTTVMDHSTGTRHLLCWTALDIVCPAEKELEVCVYRRRREEKESFRCETQRIWRLYSTS